jgi:pyrophosphatase PpaX
MDLDQTLVDTRDAIVAAFQYVFLAQLQRALSRDEVLAIYGHPLRWQMGTLAGEERADQLVQSYRSHFPKVEYLIRPYPEWPQVLTELRRRGYKLGVVTSKSHLFAGRHLAMHGLDILVDVLVALEDVTEHKPHPAPCLLAAKWLEIEPEGCLMIGDSPWDILAGQRAGMKTALAHWGEYEPGAFDRESAVADVTLASPKDLLGLLPDKAGS